MGPSFLLFVGLTSWLWQRNSALPRYHPCTSSAGASTRPSIARPRHQWALFSQLSQQQIGEDIEKRYLRPLIKQAGLEVNDFEVQKLSDLGFANNVFRLKATTENHILVAKVFSDLAKRRLNPNQAFMGEIDEMLFHQGIGPPVLAHTSDALLMEYIDGDVLTEPIVFDASGDAELSICKAVGQKLGHMHTLEGKGGPDNMLWHALEVLLSSIDPKFDMKADSGDIWTLNKLQDTIGECRNRLESLDIPCVPIGHGDFKLTNVMITRQTKEIRFIDFELSGPHYRGYDLAKFFRSSKDSIAPQLRCRHQMAFWESYQKQVSRRTGMDGESAKSMAESVLQLEWEAELLEPMTWLEAAAFFLSMAYLDDPSQKDKWSGMALDRLVSFEKMKQETK